MLRGMEDAPLQALEFRGHDVPAGRTHDGEEQWAGYNAIILLFCVCAIGMLVIGETVQCDPPSRSILGYADLAVCLVFLVDFVVSFTRAESKWRYMVTWGWLDLLSAIPVLDAMRWGRAARILRVLRVIRGIKATRILMSLALKYRARNAAMAGSFITILVVFASSFAILQFEDAPESKIKSAEDAVWWALCTITTVGYGDLYPVTWQGRTVAAVLMITGVSIFGAIAGMLASWFTDAHENSDRAQLQRLTAEVAALRRTIEQTHAQQQRTTPFTTSQRDHRGQAA